MEPCEINMIIMVRKFVDTLYVRTIAIDYYLQGSDSIYKMISITSWLNTNQWKPIEGNLCWILNTSHHKLCPANGNYNSRARYSGTGVLRSI